MNDNRYVPPVSPLGAFPRLAPPDADPYPDSDRFRIPEPRAAHASFGDYNSIGTESRSTSRHSDPTGPDLPGRDLPGRYTQVGPRSGEPLPPLPGDHPPAEPSIGERQMGPIGPADEPLVRHATETIDRTAMRRPVGGPAPSPGGVTYRSRWPGLTALHIALGVVFELPAIRIFVLGLTSTSPSSMIAGSFMIMGVPLFAYGLYALLTGGAVVPGQPATRVWLRGSLAALPVGLILFIAAALAVGSR